MTGTPRSGRQSERRVRILVVEDSAPMRKRLGREIGRIPGTEVAGYSSGAREAVETLERAQIDLVVADLRLSEGTGFDVLRWMRHNRQGTPVVVLSNLAVEPIKQECRSEGAVSCFDKSLEFDEFLAEVRRLAEHLLRDQ